MLMLDLEVSNARDLENFGIFYKAPFDARMTKLLDASIDACVSTDTFEHIPKDEILEILKELKRILKPGGINIFTVRHTGDGDFKNGIHLGEDLYENDGFIVHFFSEEKVKKISKGFDIKSINEFYEGKFPRKLFIVTLKKN